MSDPTDLWNQMHGSTAVPANPTIGADSIMKLLQSGYSMQMIQSLAKSGGIQKALVGAMGGQINALPGKRVQAGAIHTSDMGGSVGGGGSALGNLILGNSPTDKFNKQYPNKTSNVGSGARSTLTSLLGNAAPLKKDPNSKVGSAISKLAGMFSSTPANPGSDVVQDPGMGTGVSQEAYTAPVFSMKDFTDEANAIAAKAYGPQYEAINSGKANAQSQYNTSDQVVEGLYQKLAEKIGASGQQQAQQYDQSSAESAARTAALEKQIANTYSGSQQQEADLMQKLGGQQAASTILPDNSAFQQSEAAVQGNDQANYYAQQKQASNDQTTGTQNAATTQGAVSRENLVRDLANVLNQYDQQQLQVSGNQSTTALDIANQLSNRDMQLQQLNAGAQTDAWNANNTLAQQQQQAAQYADETAYNRGQDAQQTQLDQSKFQVDSANAASQLQLERTKAGIGADGRPLPQAVDPKSLPVAAQIVTQGEQLDRGNGQRNYDFIAQWIQSHGNVMGDLDSIGFSQQVAYDAAQQGLNGSVVAAMAGSVYKQMLGR